MYNFDNSLFSAVTISTPEKIANPAEDLVLLLIGEYLFFINSKYLSMKQFFRH